jgi:hypothetical protein
MQLQHLLIVSTKLSNTYFILVYHVNPLKQDMNETFFLPLPHVAFLCYMLCHVSFATILIY